MSALSPQRCRSRAATQKDDRVLTMPDDASANLAPLSEEALTWAIRLHSRVATSDDTGASAQGRYGSPKHDTVFHDPVKPWRMLGGVARDLAPKRDATWISLARRSHRGTWKMPRPPDEGFGKRVTAPFSIQSRTP